MLIPALICLITVVSVLHSELEAVQTAFPSSRNCFIKPRSIREDMRTGQRWCAGDMTTVCEMTEQISFLTNDGYSPDSDRRQASQVAKEQT